MPKFIEGQLWWNIEPFSHNVRYGERHSVLPWQGQIRLNGNQWMIDKVHTANTAYVGNPETNLFETEEDANDAYVVAVLLELAAKSERLNDEICMIGRFIVEKKEKKAFEKLLEKNNVKV